MLSFCLFTLLAASAFGETCAKNFKELDQSPRLQELKNLLPAEGTHGFVNGTKGSYFFIESSPERFKILFFTTGLFDMYGIRREGELTFCDDGTALTATGLDRKQTLFVTATTLQFDERKPRQTFTRGEMPETLRRINNWDASQVTLNDSKTP